MSRKASFWGTDAMRSTKNRSRLHPTGGLRPAWTEPPASHYVPHMPKRSQTQNRTFHLLFKADILTCYEQGTPASFSATKLGCARWPNGQVIKLHVDKT